MVRCVVLQCGTLVCKDPNRANEWAIRALLLCLVLCRCRTNRASRSRSLRERLVTLCLLPVVYIRAQVCIILVIMATCVALVVVRAVLVPVPVVLTLCRKALNRLNRQDAAKVMLLMPVIGIPLGNKKVLLDLRKCRVLSPILLS